MTRRNFLRFFVMGGFLSILKKRLSASEKGTKRSKMKEAKWWKRL